MPHEGRTLPAPYYTDQAVFEQEMERFFARRWVYAGREEDVPEPGSYVLVDVAGESLILLRTRSGLAVFFNVCRHRGTRLCADASGRLPGAIQCPYHAWTYDLEGRLVGAPHMDDLAHFSKADHSLTPARLETWDGHLFVNLDPGAAPLAAQIGGLIDRFRPWRMEELRRGGRLSYEIRANWKLVIQNYSECLHCPLIHPLLNRFSHYLSGDNEPIQPGYMGGRMDLEEGVQSMTRDGRTARACLPDIGAADRRSVHYYAIFPNLLLTLHPDYMMAHTLWPRAVDRTVNVCDFYFHPSELAKSGFDPSDALEFWDLTNRQDWHVCELAQQGISSRAYRPGPYSSREDLLYAFDQMVRRDG